MTARFTRNASTSNLKWTHPSITALPAGRNPVDVILDRTRDLVVRARDEGWNGPPFDPLALADLLGVPVVANADVVDARTVPEDGEVRIEFNPNRPAGRRRFSIAHEVAHLLFEDHADAVRERLQKIDQRSDDWQLEMLCNIAAAEIIMPAGSFSELRSEAPDLHHLLDLRKSFGVSIEAMLLRTIHLTDEPAAMFAASRGAGEAHDYRIDYSVPSLRWNLRLDSGARIPLPTVVSECTAIGFTAFGTEQWLSDQPTMLVEAVGVPAYPGHRLPRVLGLLRPTSEVPSEDVPRVQVVFGDATQPRGDGTRVIAHIVNDRAKRFHGGFAGRLSTRWPRAAEDFTDWVSNTPEQLHLGQVHFTDLGARTWVADLVAQHGYGKSPRPRIRYQALRQSLTALAEWALSHDGTVHMPRIGTGQAGGDWDLVFDLITDELVDRGVSVTIYDPPGRDPAPRAPTLDLGI